MISWPPLKELPAGYELLEGTIGVLAVAQAVRGELLAAGFGPDGGEVLEASDLSGRTRLDRLPLANGGQAVVRRFTHGGLARVVTGERYADPQRPFWELVLASRLAAAGVDTVEVLAARAIRRKPFGWQLAVVTRRLEHVVDLAVLLEAWRAGAGTPATRRAVVRAVGRAIGRLHAVGFVHADLHPRNLLLAEDALETGATRVHVIDLDRSRFVPDLPDRTRRRNLARFVRAVEKREQRGASFLTRGDALRFLLAYGDELGGWGTDREAWKTEWRCLRSIGGSTRWVHALGWGLERMLGKGPAGRDGDAWVRAAPSQGDSGIRRGK